MGIGWNGNNDVGKMGMRYWIGNGNDSMGIWTTIVIPVKDLYVKFFLMFCIKLCSLTDYFKIHICAKRWLIGQFNDVNFWYVRQFSSLNSKISFKFKRYFMNIRHIATSTAHWLQASCSCPQGVTWPASIVPDWRLSALDRHRPPITAIGWCLDVCHKKNTNASRRQEFFRRWTVSLELSACRITWQRYLTCTV